MRLKVTAQLSLLAFAASLSCTSEEPVAMRVVNFEGHIKSGETNGPVTNVKVVVSASFSKWPSPGYETISDSTFTDAKGDYKLTIPYNRAELRPSQYVTEPYRAYWEQCSSGSSIIPFPSFYIRGEIDTLNVNSRNFTMCNSGEIKLQMTKLNPGKMDTLFYRQDLDVTGNTTFIFATSTVTKDQDVHLLKYFNQVIKSTFQFRAKKEDGTVTEWEQEVVVEMGKTKVVEVEF